MRLLASALTLATAMLPVVASAQIEERMTTVSFTNGCKLEWPRRYYKAELLSARASFTWTGDCVAGLAQGLGTLTERTGNPDTDDTYTIIGEKTFFHDGRPFGYSLRSIRSKLNKILAPEFGKSYAFRGEGVKVEFSEEGTGLKMDIDPFLTPAPAPVSTATLMTSWILESSTRGIGFVASACDRPGPSGQPFCKDKGGRPVFYILEWKVPWSDFVSTPCPDPHSPSGCEDLIATKSSPVRQEVVAFIERNRAAVDAMVASMNAKPQEERDRAVATKQKLAEEEIAFRSDLQRMNPGQLFALADKSLADGNVSKAREALRALIERFPDHPLAATASQQLAGLSMRSGAPGKATSGDTKGESTRVEGGAASPVVQSPSADAAKAQQVRQVQEQSQRQAESKAEWQSAAQAIANSAALLDAQRRAGAGVATAAGLPGASPQEACRCGPDYIPCWVRNAKRSGTTYRVASADGWDSISSYDSKGLHIGNKGWKRGTTYCSNILK